MIQGILYLYILITALFLTINPIRLLVTSISKRKSFWGLLREAVSDYPWYGFVAIFLFILVAPAMTLYHFQTYVPDGTYCYKVLLSNGKNEYTLPAEIIKSTEEIPSGRRDRDGMDIMSTVDSYYIYNAYWPDGGYLSFEGQEVEFGRYVNLSDTENGDNWRCMLTKARDFHPQIEENINREIPWEIYLVSAASGCWFLFLYAYITRAKISEKQSL